MKEEREEEEITLPSRTPKEEEEEGREEPVACACLSNHIPHSAAAARISLASSARPCASLSLATHSNLLICPATVVGCKAVGREGGRAG